MELDTDGDKILDCQEVCVFDPKKTQAGVCGCGVADIDTDQDGTLDCLDQCATDKNKTTPGACGCLFFEVKNAGAASCASHPPFARDTQPVNAPDLIVNESKNSVKVLLQEYSSVEVQITTGKAALAPSSAKKKGPKTLEVSDISYNVILEAKGKAKDIANITSKKNIVTIKNLKPGSYNAKYRVMIRRNDSTVLIKTNFSPSAEFSIVN